MTTNDIRSEFIPIGDHQLCLHHYPTTTPEPTTVVLLFHGFLAHGLYPTVKYAAQVLQKQNLRVLSYDMQGHGRSEGLSGYLPSAEAVVQEAVAVTQYVQNKYLPKKFFLVGSSMGGAIALGVSQQISVTGGVILLAPMLQLSVSSFEQVVLQGLAAVLPTLSCIPSKSTSADLQYRDPAKRQECEDDPLVPKTNTIRVGSANTCVQLTKRVSAVAPTAPLLILLADEDVIVQNEGAERLFAAAECPDKTLKRYPGALHGLLCETRPLLDQIEHDLVEWVQARL
ncbi:acylglycerol lipase [Fistulifera solaris]|jgi:acylglycerol lipase|uniref:Acylglycerol lipase n=1 Tax=Fistulifera solaris TaxID=1519565 RepID=A0A1Z5JAL6_FISSO|nr:acylglycerol lipase [Fistulifera solaris]|eukprot:GAX10868.1 acylglycerol lipase [Fistulifera solaris]